MSGESIEIFQSHNLRWGHNWMPSRGRYMPLWGTGLDDAGLLGREMVPLIRQEGFVIDLDSALSEECG